MSEREQFEKAFAKITSKAISIRGMAWAVWQAARAQPAQAGQVLTDDFIKAEALEAFDCYWDADDETLVNKYGHGVYLSRFIDFARAIEQAVMAKRVPMTEEQIEAALWGPHPAEVWCRDFRAGVRAAERHHGIVGEKGGVRRDQQDH